MTNQYPTKAIWSTVLLCLLFAFQSNAQTVLFEETFDNPVTAFGWTWSPDGTASNAQYWDNRPAILSESGGGALMVNADSITQSGAGFTEAFFGFSYTFDNFSPSSRYFLQFNQYYRNLQSHAFVEAAVGEFQTQQIFNNDNIGPNIETSYKDVVTLEITDYIIADSVFLQFVFFGDYYFWIIDDIQIIEDNNPYPPQILWGNVPGQGDFNGGMNGWTTTGISDPNALWEWEADGKADKGAFADLFGSQPILSPTLSNGAMVFDSDFYDNGGDDQNLGNGPVPAVQVSALTSPIIDLTGVPAGNLLLTFNQYFAQGNSQTFITHSSDGGTTWSQPISVNQNVPEDQTTPPYDQITIPLVGAVPTDQFQVQFLINGNYYFWIIDDVQIGINTLYPETFPPYIGDSLLTYGIPYDVDCDKGPVVPNQLIVQFSPGTPPMVKDSIRSEFGVAHVDSCMCSVVELWHFGPDTSSTMGPSPTGISAGINEKKAKATGTSSVDGVDLNRFVWNELQGAPPPVFTQLQTAPNIPGGPSDVLIAILDTGVDFEHTDLVQYIYKNDNETLDSLDEDNSCLIDDVVGYNFVRDNNNPQDDHSHGTHIAGIVKQNLQANAMSCPDFKLLPLKTHNENGVAELFDIVCAFYYALSQGADVINCSWGWYDTDSEILTNFLDTAALANYNTLAITAAGNDTIDLSDHPQFPACNASGNIISVGSAAFSAVDTTFSLFSNFDPFCVDIAAPGENILSTLPGDGNGEKTGTSMAAPAVAAAAAEIYCQGNVTLFSEIKNCILDNALQVSALAGSVMNGQLLSFNLPCITGVENLPETPFDILVYPNPGSGNLTLTTDFNLNGAEVVIMDPLGRKVLSKSLQTLNAGEGLNLDISHFAAGVYFISVQVGNNIKTLKIIKH